jgi:hypothetical protein
MVHPNQGELDRTCATRADLAEATTIGLKAAPHD